MIRTRSEDSQEKERDSNIMIKSKEKKILTKSISKQEENTIIEGMMTEGEVEEGTIDSLVETSQMKGKEPTMVILPIQALKKEKFKDLMKDN